MAERAKGFRDRLGSASGLRSGVYVYKSSVFSYSSEPQKLAARIALLGFGDVYLSPDKSKITSADAWLRTFISSLASYGISTYDVRIADLKYLASPSSVGDEVALITAYNGKVAENERFAGISADLEPHTCKGSSVPSGLAYEWNGDTGYGTGGANDKLLGLTLDCMKEAGNQLHKAGLKLNEAVSYNYQRKFDDKLLSYGSAPQFLQYCDHLVTMSYFDTKENIWSKSLNTIVAADAGHPKSVSVCVKTTINNVTDSKSLQNKGWAYLLETADYVIGQGQSHAAFRGFDIFNYEGLEIMWKAGL